MQVMSVRKRETIGWIDALRVIAIVLVVISHCCDHFTALYDIDAGGYMLGAIVGSFVRPCVPLFAMMTGVLLLPVNKDMTLRGFYKKRMGRLLLPLAFWSIVLPIANYLAYNYVWTDPKNLSLVGPFDISNLVNHLYTWILNFNYDTIPFWYIYMLIGIYMILPIVSRWLETASKKDIETVLWIWGFSLLVPYITYYSPMLGFQGNYGVVGLWGVCSWNIFGTFYYVSGFIGYMLLAYYLTRWPMKWRNFQLASVSIMAFLVGFAITTYGYITMMETQNWILIEMFWSFCSINVLLMTAPIFIWVERSKVKGAPWLTALATMSFGVYLCHFSLVQWGYEIFWATGFPAWLRLLLNVACSCIVSFFIVWLMMKNKLLRRFVV